MRRLPKRLSEPAGGLTIEEEPDDLKAARLLATLRYMIDRNMWTLGITIGEASIMLVRFRPTPDGPHNPNADLSGVVL